MFPEKEDTGILCVCSKSLDFKKPGSVFKNIGKIKCICQPHFVYGQPLVILTYQGHGGGDFLMPRARCSSKSKCLLCEHWLGPTAPSLLPTAWSGVSNSATRNGFPWIFRYYPCPETPENSQVFLKGGPTHKIMLLFCFHLVPPLEAAC